MFGPYYDYCYWLEALLGLLFHFSSRFFAAQDPAYRHLGMAMGTLALLKRRGSDWLRPPKDVSAVLLWRFPCFQTKRSKFFDVKTFFRRETEGLAARTFGLPRCWESTSYEPRVYITLEARLDDQEENITGKTLKKTCKHWKPSNSLQQTTRKPSKTFIEYNQTERKQKTTPHDTTIQNPKTIHKTNNFSQNTCTIQKKHSTQLFKKKKTTKTSTKSLKKNGTQRKHLSSSLRHCQATSFTTMRRDSTGGLAVESSGGARRQKSRWKRGKNLGKHGKTLGKA